MLMTKFGSEIAQGSYNMVLTAFLKIVVQTVYKTAVSFFTGLSIVQNRATNELGDSNQ